MAKSAEQERQEDIGASIAATLIGAVSFMMSLYYLTNYREEGIRKHTYGVISDTISIFCAVLLFTVCDDLVDMTFRFSDAGDGETSLNMVTDMCHMFLWFATLQVVIGFCSGAMIATNKRKKIVDLEIDMKSSGTLIGHITGFAALNALSAFQQLSAVRNSLPSVFAAAILAFIFLFILTEVTHEMRTLYADRGDNKVDEWEKLWDEQAEDAEYDVTGVASSFLLVQSFRKLISGELPEQRGDENMSLLSSHGCGGAAVLVLVGFFHLGLAFVILYYKEKILENWFGERPTGKAGKGVEEEESGTRAHRFVNLLVTICGFTFAWCVFYGTKWSLAWIPSFNNNPELLQIVEALLISFCACAAIFWFEHLEGIFKSSRKNPSEPDPERRRFTLADGVKRVIDTKLDNKSKKHVKFAIEHLCSMVGILVGFSWEQCFDESVDSLSEKLPASRVSAIGLSLFCAALVFPAWKWYVLPMVLREGWRCGFPIEPQKVHSSIYKALKSLEKTEKRNKGWSMETPLLENDAPTKHVQQYQEEHRQAQKCLATNKKMLETIKAHNKEHQIDVQSDSSDSSEDEDLSSEESREGCKDASVDEPSPQGHHVRRGNTHRSSGTSLRRGSTHRGSKTAEIAHLHTDLEKLHAELERRDQKIKELEESHQARIVLERAFAHRDDQLQAIVDEAKEKGLRDDWNSEALHDVVCLKVALEGRIESSMGCKTDANRGLAMNGTFATCNLADNGRRTPSPSSVGHSAASASRTSPRRPATASFDPSPSSAGRSDTTMSPSHGAVGRWPMRDQRVEDVLPNREPIVGRTPQRDLLALQASLAEAIKKNREAPPRSVTPPRDLPSRMDTSNLAREIFRPGLYNPAIGMSEIRPEHHVAQFGSPARGEATGDGAFDRAEVRESAPLLRAAGDVSGDTRGRTPQLRHSVAFESVANNST